MKRVLAVVLFASVCCAQPTGPVPKLLNIVYHKIQPDRTSAYAFLEAAIVRGYSQANIPVHWMALPALAGQPEVLYLNLFESFAELEKAGAAVRQGMAAHPDLAPMQDRLAGMVRDMTTVLTVRRDDMGYRVSSIDFAKMRVLRVTTFSVRPGHEGEFVEAAKSIAAAHEKVRADAAWAVYQVNAGRVAPAFVLLTPMRSLEDADRALARTPAIEDVAGPACQSWESQLYVVSREMSHVRKEFFIADPEFWLPKSAPER